MPTWLKQGLEQLEREKQRKAEQEASRKKRKSRWSDADEDDTSQVYLHCPLDSVVYKSCSWLMLFVIVVYSVVICFLQKLV